MRRSTADGRRRLVAPAWEPARPVRVAIVGRARPASTSPSCSSATTRATRSRCTSGTGSRTPSASAWCSPTRPWRTSARPIPRPTRRWPRPRRAGTTSRSTTAARSSGRRDTGSRASSGRRSWSCSPRRAQVARRRDPLAAGDPGLSDCGLPAADLIVAADGAASAIRDRLSDRFQPQTRLAPQPLRLARHHPPLPRVHLLLQVVAGRALAHPRLPVRAGPLDLHRRGEGGDLAGERSRRRTTSGQPSRTWSGSSAMSCGATRSWPTAPSGGGSPPSGTPVGTRATWSCWATPPTRRTSRWARAPSWRWRTRSRWRRR